MKNTRVRIGVRVLFAVALVALVLVLSAPKSSADVSYPSVLSNDTVVEMVPVICTDSECDSPFVMMCHHKNNKHCQFNVGGQVCVTGGC